MLAAPISVSPSITSGTATINFGLSNKTAEVIVTGLTSVSVNSKVFTSMRIEETSTHSVDDLLIDPIRLAVKSIVSGAGFTIYGEMENATANGIYNVNWFFI